MYIPFHPDYVWQMLKVPFCIELMYRNLFYGMTHVSVQHESSIVIWLKECYSYQTLSNSTPNGNYRLYRSHSPTVGLNKCTKIMLWIEDSLRFWYTYILTIVTIWRKLFIWPVQLKLFTAVTGGGENLERLMCGALMIDLPKIYIFIIRYIYIPKQMNGSIVIFLFHKTIRF